MSEVAFLCSLFSSCTCSYSRSVLGLIGSRRRLLRGSGRLDEGRFVWRSIVVPPRTHCSARSRKEVVGESKVDCKASRLPRGCNEAMKPSTACRGNRLSKARLKVKRLSHPLRRPVQQVCGQWLFAETRNILRS